MITQPTDEVLLKYTSGVLDPALRLLVERHFEIVPGAKKRLPALNRFGGELLTAESGVAMATGSLESVLERLGKPERREPAPAFPPLDKLGWRWAGPGRSIANVEVAGSRMKSYALRIAPGRAMLQHSHAAHEWTLIVQGSYRDEGGEYSTGSFIEEDEETDHQPVATGDQDCICLAVMSGALVAPGLIGKAARWLMR